MFHKSPRALAVFLFRMELLLSRAYEQLRYSFTKFPYKKTFPLFDYVTHSPGMRFIARSLSCNKIKTQEHFFKPIL
jgi:hypothetical protein